MALPAREAQSQMKLRLFPNPRLVFDIIGPWTPFSKRLEKVAKEHPYRDDKVRQASVKARDFVLKLGFLKGGKHEEVVEETEKVLGEKIEEVVGDGEGAGEGN